MNKELRELRILAGLPIVEDTNNDENQDGEDSPLTYADDNVDMVREFDDDYNPDFEPETNICPDCEGRGHLGHLNKGEEFDCPRCDGMGEVFEDMTREDYLVPPKKDAYDDMDEDEHDLVLGKTSVGRSYDATDLGDDAKAVDGDDDFWDWTKKYPGEDLEEDSDLSTNDFPTEFRLMNRKSANEMAQELIDGGVPAKVRGAYVIVDLPSFETGPQFVQNTAAVYDAYRVSNEAVEESPREKFDHDEFERGQQYRDEQRKTQQDEFDYNDDAIVDVGDDEDYEEFDFDDEFEQMMGNTNKFEAVDDINELRKMAGLPVKEDDIESSEDLDDEYKRDMEFQLRNKADKDHEVEEASHSKDDYDAFEFNDEKAYYLVSDEIGDQIEFGMNDEILVPEQHTDTIIALLTDHGFENGEHFSIAGMEEDLQNGYDDRAFTDGDDYFPKGATSSPATDLGPTAGRHGDNPMRTPMASVDKEDEIYESYRKAYRRFRKK